MTQSTGMAYDASDVSQIFKNTGAKNWNELSDFIRSKGDSVWHITTEGAKQMAKDIKSLSESGEDFTDNPQEVLSLVKKNHKKSSQQQQASQSNPEQNEQTDEDSESIFVKIFNAF